MSPPSPTAPDLPLALCEPWPAMFSLPERLNTALGDLALAAGSYAGRRIFRKDIVGALISVSAPEKPDELRQLYERYISPKQVGGSLLLGPRAHVMVRLPAPVSLRLDGLVTRARGSLGGRVVRSDVVGALLLAAPTEPERLDDLYHRYTQLEAKDAALAGEPVEAVLSRRRPDAGVRPHLPGTRRRGAAGRRRSPAS